MPSAVSFRYASALADTLAAPGAGRPTFNPETIATQLEQFHQLLGESNELRIVFSTPAVSTDKKKAILAKLAPGAGLDSITANFLSVVIDHDRMGLLGEIIEAFQTILHERMGTAIAEVTTARPLEESEQKELTAALSAKTGKSIRLNLLLDPNLIGGVVARIGSVIYDGSIRGYLSRLRTELTSE
ncbi:MAG: ATP synthase F1 subunit delta [Acidobacteria bacterium]|nr:ATP synthase F1 subunit delta [Acidobacteriota bacterium]